MNKLSIGFANQLNEEAAIQLFKQYSRHLIDTRKVGDKDECAKKVYGCIDTLMNKGEISATVMLKISDFLNNEFKIGTKYAKENARLDELSVMSVCECIAGMDNDVIQNGKFSAEEKALIGEYQAAVFAHQAALNKIREAMVKNVFAKLKAFVEDNSKLFDSDFVDTFKII